MQSRGLSKVQANLQNEIFRYETNVVGEGKKQKKGKNSE